MASFSYDPYWDYYDTSFDKVSEEIENLKKKEYELLMKKEHEILKQNYESLKIEWEDKPVMKIWYKDYPKEEPKKVTAEKSVPIDMDKLKELKEQDDIRKTIKKQYEDNIRLLKAKLKDEMTNTLALKKEVNRLQKENNSIKKKLQLAEKDPVEYKRRRNLDPYDEEEWDK